MKPNIDELFKQNINQLEGDPPGVNRDPDSSWNRIRDELGSPQPSRRRAWIALAASVAIVATIGLLFSDGLSFRQQEGEMDGRFAQRQLQTRSPRPNPKTVAPVPNTQYGNRMRGGEVHGGKHGYYSKQQSASKFQRYSNNNSGDLSFKRPPPPPVVSKFNANGGTFRIDGNMTVGSGLAVSADSIVVYYDDNVHSEDYAKIIENDFLAVRDEPLSTFSIDVDRASYANHRRFINSEMLPPPNSVRIEEFINYFDYQYPQPRGRSPFSIHTELSDSPWKAGNKLVQIGLQGRDVQTKNVPPSNLVFLLDVSGSMADETKLPLLKGAFRLLVEELRPQDRISIVVYAGAAGVVLPPTPGSQKQTILDALDRLEAGGSTAGGAGIELAYRLAKQNFMREGNNRVVLATDGDFNVGVSSETGLENLIVEKRKDGIFLTVLGLGTGNYKDAQMEMLADKGNGNFAYIDNMREARKVLVSEFGGTLYTIAKDVKIQVEFNPAKVKSYRLIGYENRALRNQDFANDRIDAGELGAGHTVTALYEIEPADGETDEGKLKYQRKALSDAAASGEWMTIKLRYKTPTGTKSRLLETTVDQGGKPLTFTTNNFRFAAAVAAYGMLLRNSAYKGTATYDGVLRLAQSALGKDKEGYRQEFITLVEKARDLEAALSAER